MFVACGLNHKTAPVDVREKVALPATLQHTLLKDLVALPAVHEAAILSTCNRTEIYCEASDPHELLPWLAKQQHVAADVIAPHFYMHHDHHGVRHTLRVASGLDSMMLGEPQILGQLKQAYQWALDAGTVRTNLQYVFQYVFKATKRIRNLSGIGNNPVSIAFAAVQLLCQHFADLESLNIFILGSGEMASLIAKYLHKYGARQLTITSRNHANAHALAQSCSGHALSISDIPQHLPNMDVVVSATACPLPFITKSLIEQAMQQRAYAPMFFLDLAVPRDIEMDVATLSNVHLYNIDDLKTMAEQGMQERRTAALQAEQLVDFELDNFQRWHRTLRAKEVICEYRNQMQAAAHQELQRAIKKLNQGENQHQVLEQFSERLVKKLTHAPTVGLRQAAWDNRDDILDLARYLLNASSLSSPYEKIT